MYHYKRLRQPPPPPPPPLDPPAALWSMLSMLLLVVIELVHVKAPFVQSIQRGSMIEAK